MNQIIDINQNIEKILEDVPINLLFNYLENKKSQIQTLEPLQEVKDLMEELQNVDIIMQNFKQKIQDSIEIQLKQLRSVKEKTEQEEKQLNQETEKTEEKFQIYESTIKSYEQTLETYKKEEEKYKKQIEKQEYATDQILSKYSSTMKENEILKKELIKLNHNHSNLKDQQEKSIQEIHSHYKKLRKFNTFHSEFNMNDVKKKNFNEEDGSEVLSHNIFQKKVEELVIKFEKSEFENKKKEENLQKLQDQFKEIQFINNQFEKQNNILQTQLSDFKQKQIQKEFKNAQIQTIPEQQQQIQDNQDMQVSFSAKNQKRAPKNTPLKQSENQDQINSSFQMPSTSKSLSKTGFLSPNIRFNSSCSQNSKMYPNLNNFQTMKQQFMQSKNYMGIKDELQELQSFYLCNLSNFNSIAPSECSEMDHRQQQLILNRIPSTTIPHEKSHKNQNNNNQQCFKKQTNNILSSISPITGKFNNDIIIHNENDIHEFNNNDQQSQSQLPLYQDFGTDDLQSLQSYQLNNEQNLPKIDQEEQQNLIKNKLNEYQDLDQQEQMDENDISLQNQNIKNRQYSYSLDAKKRQNSKDYDYELEDYIAYIEEDQHIDNHFIDNSQSSGGGVVSAAGKQKKKSNKSKKVKPGKKLGEIQVPGDKQQEKDTTPQKKDYYQTPKFSNSEFISQEKLDTIFSRDSTHVSEDKSIQTVEGRECNLDLQQQLKCVNNDSIQYLLDKMNQDQKKQNVFMSYFYLLLISLMLVIHLLVGFPVDIVRSIFSISQKQQQQSQGQKSEKDIKNQQEKQVQSMSQSKKRGSKNKQGSQGSSSVNNRQKKTINSK